MRRVGFAAGLLLAAYLPASAQIPGVREGPDLDYWYDVFYPKIFYAGKEGFLAGAYFALVQPLRSRDFDRPPPYRISISLDGQASTSGSRFIKLEGRAPGLANGWRISARLTARRRAKDNYFGIGNATLFDSDSVTGAQPNFYRVARTQYVARTEIQRVLVGPLRALAGLNVERWKLARHAGPSVFATDLTIDPSIGVSTDDFSARVGLVFDTRDDEVASGRGVLVEAIWGVADSSIAGDLSYTRTTLSARGFVTPSPRLQLGARVVAQIMGGSPRVGSFYLIEGSDRFSEGIGGGDTHRALRDNRLLGRDKLFTNIDVRYALFAIPTLYRVSLLGFLDAGRIFDDVEGEDFEVTTNGLKVGAGSGLFFQLGRAGLAGFTVGVGPEGVSSDFHTKWTF